MKRSKKLVVLSGVLAAACAATCAVTAYEERKEQIKNSDEVILELDPETVTALSWEYGTEYLAFHRGNDEDAESGAKWLYDEDEAFPVSQEKLAELQEIFEAFGVSFIIEDVDDFGQYGLDNPVCTIHMKTEEKDYEILLGDFSAMDSERYVSVGDGNVYLVKEDPFELFEVTIRDMIDHDETPYFYDVLEVKYEGAENYTVKYEDDSENTYREDDMYFVAEAAEDSDAEAGTPLDTVRVDCYLQVISNLDLEDYVTYNVTEEELEEYGLDDPELSVTVQHKWEDSETKNEKEDTFVIHISRNPEDAERAEELEAKAEEKGESVLGDGEDIPAYVRIGDSQIVYEITEYQYGNLMAASYNDLRHWDVLPAEFADIDQFVIILEDNEYTIETTGNAENRVYKYQGEQLEIETLKAVMEELSVSESDDFTDEEPAEKEELRLKVRLGVKDKPEKEIVFYRYDGEYCLVTMDGEPLSLVKRSLVMDVVEEIYAIVLN